jgi:Type II intron maturase
VEYYLLAGDVYRLNRLRWVAETSMLKTLARKHYSTVSTTADRYRATIDTPYGPRRCFQVTVEREGRQPLVARFGGIPLRRKKDAVLTDRVPPPVTVRRKELVTRLQAGRCELCGQPGPVDVHQVRKLDSAGTVDASVISLEDHAFPGRVACRAPLLTVDLGLRAEPDDLLATWALRPNCPTKNAKVERYFTTAISDSRR